MAFLTLFRSAQGADARRQAALALAVFTAAFIAQAAPSGPPVVVVRNCSGCHGIEGRPQMSYVPSLAGQSAKYIEARLQQFRQFSSPPVDEAIKPHIHRSHAANKDAVTSAAAVHMIGIAKTLSDSDTKAAARWYSAQTLVPAKSRKGSGFEQGKDLYLNGRQAQNVPACQSCHGPEGLGTTLAPRLAGQQPAYVLSQLDQFRSGGRAQSPMTQIARSLDENQIQAIAAYLHAR